MISETARSGSSVMIWKRSLQQMSRPHHTTQGAVLSPIQLHHSPWSNPYQPSNATSLHKSKAASLCEHIPLNAVDTFWKGNAAPKVHDVLITTHLFKLIEETDKYFHVCDVEM